MNKEQLFDLTERVKLVAGVEFPVIVGSQSLYGVTSHVPDIVKRSVECDFLLLAVGPPAFRAVIERSASPAVSKRRTAIMPTLSASPPSCCLRLLLSGFLCRLCREATHAQQLCDEHAHVFVQVEFDKEAAHKSLTRGSMSSSGTRLRSICRLISSMWSL